jgi:uncharacterized protein YcgI (DUF1989 family)
MVMSAGERVEGGAEVMWICGISSCSKCTCSTRASTDEPQLYLLLLWTCAPHMMRFEIDASAVPHLLLLSIPAGCCCCQRCSSLM